MRDQLTGNNVGAAEIFKEGIAAGFAKRTIQRAGKRIGVKSDKASFAAGWIWSLPAKMPKGSTRAPTAPSASSAVDVAPSEVESEEF